MLVHPNLAGAVADWEDGIGLVDCAAGQELVVPGTIDRSARAEAIEEAARDVLHFASHLRQERVGEFTIGNTLHRSESFAIVRQLILHHLVTTAASSRSAATGVRL